MNVPSAITWPKPSSGGDQISGVLNAGDLGFSVVADSQTEESVCGFWREVAAAVTNLGGMFLRPYPSSFLSFAIFLKN